MVYIAIIGYFQNWNQINFQSCFLIFFFLTRWKKSNNTSKNLQGISK